MAKKAFFNERTANHIRGMNLKMANSSRGLVDKILGMDPGNDTLQICFPIIPGKFLDNRFSPSDVARKAYKHGEYTALKQTKTIGESMDEIRLPHQIREESLSFLTEMKEGEINVQGYSFKPLQGSDRRKRVVPFTWIVEGARLFAYAMQTGEGLPVKPYIDSGKVATEGGIAVVRVPSREDKKPRYNIRVDNIPIADNEYKHAISLGFNTSYAEGRVPEHQLWSFGFKNPTDTESSKQIIFYPHDVAAMHGISKYFFEQEINKNEKGNRVPWDMGVFAKPSSLTVDFYLKLCNNTVIQDPKLSGKSKVRKLNIPEKSILLGRLVGRKGVNETLFWKSGRDANRLQDYDWDIRE